jgi:molybdenum cofactor biosynthesis protein B
MEYQDHKDKAFKEVRLAVMKVSDIMKPETNTEGNFITKCLQDASHSVLLYRIVNRVPLEIRRTLEEFARYERLQAAIVIGGTGLSERDVTYETIENVIEKRIPGFGELFRYLSYQEIGSAAMMSRATAGIYQGKLIFSIPGSDSAVRLAMERLILPELGHMVWDANG